MTNSEDRHKTGILSVCLNPPVSILHWMMCILSLDRPVLRKWFHVWIIFTFFAGLLVIVCDKILLLRWYYCCLSFIFTNAFLFLTWPLTPWVLFALRMPCEWKEMHYCLFTRWKKNETLLLMFLNMLQMWEFGFLFLNVDELVIYSPVQYFYSTWSFFSVTIVFIDYFISPHGGTFCWILIK